MYIDEKIRNKGFWILDKLKGGRVKNNLKEIDHVFNNYEDIKTQSALSKKIDEILNYAIETTGFYKEEAKDNILEAFPVIDKQLIKDNLDCFVSDKYEKENLHEMVTSGSTGTPFKVLQNASKRIRNTADTIYFADKAGFEIGHKLVYMKVWNELNRKSKFKKYSENVWPVDVKDLSDKHINNLLAELSNDNSRKGFLGYASSIESISKYLSENTTLNENFNVRSIITIAEALNPKAKSMIEDQFNCAVVSRYSNMENGILAQQIPGKNQEFLINVPSYFIEILKFNEDKSVEQDELGRIVVTDYYNYGMPLIRYDTGDVGSLKKGENTVPFLENVNGRKMDMIFNTNQELVSSFTVTNSMWKYTELDQYQFIQKDKKDYLFKLNIKEKFTRENELIHEFKDYLGKDANIEIEFINEIPLLSSGKRKKVVNKMVDL